MDKFSVKTPGLVFLEANKSFSGDHGGMWYRLKYTDGKLSAWVWPLPYCFDKTDDALKTFAEFDFTPEGLAAAEQWVVDQYEADPEGWKKNPFLPLGEPVPPEPEAPLSEEDAQRAADIAEAPFDL